MIDIKGITTVVTTKQSFADVTMEHVLIASAYMITVHCSVVSGPSVEAGDSVSVKVPQRAADVVIVVEQDIRNSELFKELVTPLVTTLSSELKTKGIQ